VIFIHPIIVSPKFFILLSTVALLLPACANTPWADKLGRSLAPDPRLKDNPAAIGLPPAPSPSASPSPITELPSTLPSGEDPASQANRVPQPGDPEFIGPVPSAKLPSNGAASPSGNSSPTPSKPTDLGQVPDEFQAYITDLTNLGALQITSSKGFEPNKAVTRREYARWLVAANNSIYASVPARKIRPGASTDQPAFKDVASNDPDFGAIQGLANAGLIPSTLSGESGTVTFRPNSPLTREDLIAWKVPVDIRRSLPNATLNAVKESWGFQDTAKIDPKILRAVLADYQNSDLSNIRRAFGYTTLFNPKKTVSRAEAAAVLWFFGAQGDGLSAKDALQSSQSGEQPGEQPSEQPSLQPNPPIGP
jgi:S-layer homology domain